MGRQGVPLRQRRTANKLYRIFPDGRKELVLEIGDPDGNTFDRNHELITCSSVLRAVLEVKPVWVFHLSRELKDAMASTLKSINYGKSRVRVAKIVRGGAQHEFADFTIDIRLQGSFEDCYLSGDNSMVVPTDTMKNTVYAMAALHGLTPAESFSLALGRHFLAEHAHVRSAKIDVIEHDWKRLDGYAFEKGAAVGLASVEVSRDGVIVEAGLDNLILLKTTNSAFTGYIKDKYTTLKETTDRILATSLKAVWRYGQAEVDYARVWESCRRVLVDVFVAHDSKAVQQTLYAMGDAVLRAHPEVAEIRLAMPNKHYFPVDLGPIGLENKNEIFLPTDEPHGQIEACLTR